MSLSRPLVTFIGVDTTTQRCQATERFTNSERCSNMILCITTPTALLSFAFTVGTCNGYEALPTAYPNTPIKRHRDTIILATPQAICRVPEERLLASLVLCRAWVATLVFLIGTMGHGSSSASKLNGFVRPGVGFRSRYRSTPHLRFMPRTIPTTNSLRSLLAVLCFACDISLIILTSVIHYSYKSISSSSQLGAVVTRRTCILRAYAKISRYDLHDFLVIIALSNDVFSSILLVGIDSFFSF
jgi:hypothetical protein